MTELEAEQSMALHNTLQQAVPKGVSQSVVFDALGAMIGCQCKSQAELRAAIAVVVESALNAFNSPESFGRMDFDA